MSSRTGGLQAATEGYRAGAKTLLLGMLGCSLCCPLIPKHEIFLGGMQDGCKHGVIQPHASPAVSLAG